MLNAAETSEVCRVPVVSASSPRSKPGCAHTTDECGTRAFPDQVAGCRGEAQGIYGGSKGEAGVVQE